MAGKWHGGKGSGQRKRQISFNQYSDNWDKAFAKKEPVPTVYGICPVCHESVEAKTNKPTEQFTRGDKITSRHYRQYGKRANYLCEGFHDLFLEPDDKIGTVCKHCGGWNLHEECGTYDTLFPECKHCGECTEG